MSYDAIRWAMAQPVEKSSTKFVLVAMANCVNADDVDLCWPSTQHLADMTAQDRKTVLDNVKRLREAGYIEDTKERKGGTGQVAVYRLKTPEIGTVTTEPPKPTPAPSPAPKSTENGHLSPTVPKTGAVPKTDSNSPEIPYEQSQFSLVTVPKTGHGTSKEPVTEPGRNKGEKARAPSIPEIPDDLLADWLVVRKAKRAGPLTPTAIAGLVREATKAGVTPAEAVKFCCEAGWQGFNAGWYAERQGKGQVRAGSGETAYQRSQRELVEQATGGLVNRRNPSEPQEQAHGLPASLALGR